MIRVCCVCHRVHRDNEWVIAPLPADELPTHGYCPECAAQARLEIRRMIHREQQSIPMPLAADSAVA